MGKEATEIQWGKHFKATFLALKIARLASPASFNLTDDMNIKQGYKTLFMNHNTFSCGTQWLRGSE